MFSAVSSSGGITNFCASDDSEGASVVERVSASIATTFNSANAAKATAVTFSFDRLPTCVRIVSRLTHRLPRGASTLTLGESGVMSIETAEEQAAMERVGALVASVLAELRAAVAPGVTTGALDERAARAFRRAG